MATPQQPVPQTPIVKPTTPAAAEAKVALGHGSQTDYLTNPEYKAQEAKEAERRKALEQKAKSDAAAILTKEKAAADAKKKQEDEQKAKVVEELKAAEAKAKAEQEGKSKTEPAPVPKTGTLGPPVASGAAAAKTTPTPQQSSK